METEVPSYWWLAHGAMEFVVLGMGTWRLTSMIVNEDGPFYIFERFRYWIGIRTTEDNVPYGTNVIAEGLSCVWCSSVWFGILIGCAYLIDPTITLIACSFLSLSTLSIIIERLVADD